LNIKLNNYFIFRTVCIWDLRKLNKKAKNRPMDEINHGKSVSSAYFSPVTGNYILSTSMDDKIRYDIAEKLSSWH
jgi:WD40 repeat protein